MTTNKAIDEFIKYNHVIVIPPNTENLIRDLFSAHKVFLKLVATTVGGSWLTWEFFGSDYWDRFVAWIDNKTLLFLDMWALVNGVVETLAGAGESAADFLQKAIDEATFAEGSSTGKSISDAGYWVGGLLGFKFPDPEPTWKEAVTDLIKSIGIDAHTLGKFDVQLENPPDYLVDRHREQRVELSDFLKVGV